MGQSVGPRQLEVLRHLQGEPVRGLEEVRSLEPLPHGQDGHDGGRAGHSEKCRSGIGNLFYATFI